MTLSKRLSSLKPKESGLPCGITRLMDAMSKEDAAALLYAMEVGVDDPRRLSNLQIQEALISEGYDISYSSIALHRRGQCRCYIGKNARTGK